jgi:hypothetical protein
MSPQLLLAFNVALLLVSYRIATTFDGDRYVCPGCGARDAHGHSVDCPWSR